MRYNCCILLLLYPCNRKNTNFSSDCDLAVSLQTRFWQRYANDVLDVVKRGVQDQMNSVEGTGSVTFTREEEENNMPFINEQVTIAMATSS